MSSPRFLKLNNVNLLISIPISWFEQNATPFLVYYRMDKNEQYST